MKKILAILLIITIALPLLTACGGEAAQPMTVMSLTTNSNSGSSSSSGSNSSGGNGGATPASDSGSSGSTAPSSSGSGDSSGNSSAAPTPSTSNSGGSSSSSSASSSTPASSPSPAYTPIERVIDVPDKPLDISDGSIYYIIIDGVKLDLLTITVQDLLNAGLNFDENEDFDENTEVDAHDTFGFSGENMYKNGSPRNSFRVTGVNLSDSPKPLRDCEIYWIGFDNKIEAIYDISIVCNLSYGCTKEELLSVFGDGYNEILSNDTIIYYNEGPVFSGKSFNFRISNGEIASIEISTNKDPWN